MPGGPRNFINMFYSFAWSIIYKFIFFIDRKYSRDITSIFSIEHVIWKLKHWKFTFASNNKINRSFLIIFFIKFEYFFSALFFFAEFGILKLFWNFENFGFQRNNHRPVWFIFSAQRFSCHLSLIEISWFI